MAPAIGKCPWGQSCAGILLCQLFPQDPSGGFPVRSKGALSFPLATDSLSLARRYYVQVNVEHRSEKRHGRRHGDVCRVSQLQAYARAMRYRWRPCQPASGGVGESTVSFGQHQRVEAAGERADVEDREIAAVPS